jgi:hypothetical protein
MMPKVTIRPDRIDRVAANEVEVLSGQLLQLAKEAEWKGLPFVAMALRNLTSLLGAECRFIQSLSDQV